MSTPLWFHGTLSRSDVDGTCASSSSNGNQHSLTREEGASLGVSLSFLTILAFFFPERTKDAGLSGQDGAYLIRTRAEQNTPDVREKGRV
jgi:hypothetical protein